MRPGDVFIVIPAYNEREALATTVSGLIPCGYTIVVVDDGSVIPEIEFLQGLPIRYLRHVSNLGQGAALQSGVEYALQEGAQIVVHFDADGQHIPDLIEKLIKPIRAGEFDVVLGSRFISRPDCAQVPFTKRILLKAGVFISWMFTRVWLTDTHNGFRAFSRAAAKCIKLTENGYAHATEVLELIRKCGARYTEIPVTVRYTEYSQAKGQGALNSINIVIDLLIRKLAK